ncbi:MAG: lipoate--protein ligase family protein [Actinomycetaceae bacterium]
MHGEYKVPGGKLVVVDLEVEGDRLTDVHLAGDFFLEPDSALADLDAVLTGQAATSTAAELAAAAATVLDRPGVEPFGITAEGVGIAVRRALGRAISWDDLTLELVRGPTLHPAMHVALDEVLPAEVAAGRRGPILRFWEWDAPLVVIGSFQSVRNEVDEEALTSYGMSVVRRVSGGGAMFMEAGNCITYSLVVPTALVEGLSFEQSYAFLDAWVLDALKEIGVNARYVPLNDITSDAGKIGGAAQKRFASGVVLHHVTMSYDIDAQKMLDVLRIGREKLSDKGVRSAAKRVDPMRSQTGMAREAIIESFLDHLRLRFDTVESGIHPEELEKAQRLVDTKFTDEKWTYRVP